jgi:1-pyrroline-4-hydroxy-2-carboxylate deaminase
VTVAPPGWRGVLPAVPTFFRPDLEVERPTIVRHIRWLETNGCAGAVLFGSVGEGDVLRPSEKLAILEGLGGSTRAGFSLIASVSTPAGLDPAPLARDIARAGAHGLMVLPPYGERSSVPEATAHLARILEATNLPCLLYNNPLSFGIDLPTSSVVALHERHPNLVAVKDSSGVPGRVRELRGALGPQFPILVGTDDRIFDGAREGAVGWVAGVANAFPRECVDLWELARAGTLAPADGAAWLPLLRLDADPRFVAWMKFLASEVGIGSARLRPPRTGLSETEIAPVRAALRGILSGRSIRHSIPFPDRAGPSR